MTILYAGSVSGEIHVAIGGGAQRFTIGVEKAGRDQFTGRVNYCFIGNDEYRSFKGRAITWTLLQELHLLTTGSEMKYGTIESSRRDPNRLKEILQRLAPDLHIDFASDKEKVEVAPKSVDDQIFNFWVNHV